MGWGRRFDSDGRRSFDERVGHWARCRSAGLDFARFVVSQQYCSGSDTFGESSKTVPAQQLRGVGCGLTGAAQATSQGVGDRRRCV